MADVYVSGALDMGSPPWITALEGIVGDDGVTIDSGPVILIAEGPIDLDADANLVGTVQRFELFVKPNTVGYVIGGLSYDARSLQSLLETGSPAVLQAALLAGNDVFDIGTGAGGRAMGYAGNDRFLGAIQASTRIDGGAGSDTFEFQSALDPSGTLHQSARMDLSSGRAILLSPTSDAAVILVSVENLRGGSGDDRLIGNSGANRLDGGAGFDTVDWTALGSPVFADLRTGTALAQGSTDTLAGIEALLGGQADDTLRGDGAANRLDGRAGADSLVGGGGDDTFAVDQAGDRVVDGIDAGFDTVRSAVTWTLGDNLDALVLLGSLARDGTGNGLANRITGNAEANRLTGLAGGDTLAGGDGDDTLAGGAGADVMDGGAGSDLYFVTNGDQVTDSGGFDTARCSGSWVLGEGIEVGILEEVGGPGYGYDLYGNWLANRLVGNGYANTLGGDRGADTLIGGGGDDRYYAVQAIDQIVELAGGGYDVVETSVDGYVLAAYVEELRSGGATATGNGLANAIYAYDADNRLDGGAGADTLVGRAGDDTYIVDNTGDVVEENEGAAWGHDRVNSSITLTLYASVEELLLTGAAAIDGRGNALDNLLIGNAAANRLDGGVGTDTLRGHGGDDTYLVDAGDLVVEASSGGGVDTVIATTSHVLAPYVEHLTLSGAGAVAGSGNGAANRITGSAVANTLEGDAGADTLVGYGGDDTLDGGTGFDMLTGGAGADRFVLRGGAADTLRDFAGGIDTLALLQATLPIGDGDGMVDAAETLAGSGGFSAAAELVIATSLVADAQDAATVAALLGSAASAYANGRSALFVVGDADEAAVWRFTSAGTDAAVAAGELQLLAVLAGATLPTAGDFVFLA